MTSTEIIVRALYERAYVGRQMMYSLTARVPDAFVMHPDDFELIKQDHLDRINEYPYLYGPSTLPDSSTVPMLFGIPVTTLLTVPRGTVLTAQDPL